MIILGIESSCDETAIAIVNDNKQILSNIIHSQIAEHQKFGGVVPEIASRSHLLFLKTLLEQALIEAKLKLSDIDAIAVTSGPGLIGGLLVGLMFAKGLCFSLEKPLIAVNHLEGHALTARLTGELEFPFLLLLLSGGHCQILLVNNVAQYEKLGGTLDDAVGESFDKVAKMLGLPYPGGPEIEKLAKYGNENKYQLPLPLFGREGCDFSFSGLKTAVSRLILVEERNVQVTNDICASFQRTIADILLDRLNNALSMISRREIDVSKVVIAGGVAANQYIYSKVSASMLARNINVVAPPIKLCTDNAAMIAWAGIERFKLGMSDSLDATARPRWPLADI